MTEKCVKGYIVASLVDPVLDALEKGQISHDQVEVALGEHAVLLDEKIDPFRWYPIAVEAGLDRLVAWARGGDERTALQALGAEQFEEIAALGVHQQLGFAEGELSGAPLSEIGSWGRLVSTMMKSVYNFSETSFEPYPAEADCFALDWSDLEGLSDIVLETTLGFIRALARRATGPQVEVTVERIASDHVRYLFHHLTGRSEPVG